MRLVRELKFTFRTFVWSLSSYSPLANGACRRILNAKHSFPAYGSSRAPTPTVAWVESPFLRRGGACSSRTSVKNCRKRQGFFATLRMTRMGEGAVNEHNLSHKPRPLSSRKMANKAGTSNARSNFVYPHFVVIIFAVGEWSASEES